MEITIEEIQKKFESLPEDLRWAIMGADVDNKIIEIGKTQNLTVEQMGQLSLETHVVMFGLVHPDKFEESLGQSLMLPPEKIKTIVNEVNEKILKSVREQVMSLHKNKDHESVPIPIEEEHSSHISSLEKAMGEGNKINIQNKDSYKVESYKVDRVYTNAQVTENKDNYKVDKVNTNTQVTESDKKISSILEQKLSGSYKTPKITTEYAVSPVSASTNNPIPIAPRVDPYRESTE